MKIKIQPVLLIVSLFIGANALAQIKDTIHLVCPFEHGSGREAKEAFTWDPPDKRVIMVSLLDTTVRSAVNGRVSNVNPADDGLFEVVIYYKDYYFWYYGVTKAFVVRGQVVTAGQSIGYNKLGTELEFRMFKNEDPLDPRDLLDCKIPKAE